MKRTAALFLSVFLSFFTLSSCSADPQSVPCREVLSAMVQAEKSLPAGRYYSLAAQDGSDEHMTDDLISLLFGNGSYPTAADGWIDCALYLSLGESPVEFAVILCKNRDVARDTAELLHIRLSAIKHTKTSPGYAEMLDGASVTLIGNYAFLIISSDTESVLRAAKKAIR